VWLTDERKQPVQRARSKHLRKVVRGGDIEDVTPFLPIVTHKQCEGSNRASPSITVFTLPFLSLGLLSMASSVVQP